MVNCLCLWGFAMFGADAVEETLGYVGSVLGPALPHAGAVAGQPPATVVGGDDGAAPGHESDSSSTSSEGSSSCESSDSDVRIIEPPVGTGVTAGLAIKVGAEEQPLGSSGLGVRPGASASDRYPTKPPGPTWQA